MTTDPGAETIIQPENTAGLTNIETEFPQNYLYDNRQAVALFKTHLKDQQEMNPYHLLARQYIADPGKIPQGLAEMLKLHNYTFSHAETLAEFLAAQDNLRSQYQPLIAAANTQVQEDYRAGTDFAYQCLGRIPPATRVFTGKPLEPHQVYLYDQQAYYSLYKRINQGMMIASSVGLNLQFLQSATSETAVDLLVHEWNHVLVSTPLTEGLKAIHLSKEARRRIREGLATEFTILAGLAKMPPRFQSPDQVEDYLINNPYRDERKLIDNNLMVKLTGFDRKKYLQYLKDTDFPEEKLRNLIRQQWEARTLILETSEGNFDPLLQRLGREALDPQQQRLLGILELAETFEPGYRPKIINTLAQFRQGKFELTAESVEETIKAKPLTASDLLSALSSSISNHQAVPRLADGIILNLEHQLFTSKEAISQKIDQALNRPGFLFHYLGRKKDLVNNLAEIVWKLSVASLPKRI